MQEISHFLRTLLNGTVWSPFVVPAENYPQRRMILASRVVCLEVSYAASLKSLKGLLGSQTTCPDTAVA